VEPRPPQIPTQRGPRAADDREATRDLRSSTLGHLDRLAGLGELVAEVVHEIRNGLVSIKTFVQLLPEQRDDPNFETRFREITDSEFARIERLLEAVLAQAAGTTTPRAEVRCDLDAVAASVTELIGVRAARVGITLEADLASGSVVAIEPDALRQVLMNLLLNALDVTHAGEAVRLATRGLGRAVELRVEDRGPGVPPEARRRIFEPYFSTRTDRAGGLGLAISRRLVEDASGTLTVRDREGGGSCFRIRLPVVNSA